MILRNAFQSVGKCTLDLKLRNFHLKFLHRIIPTNSFLFKVNIKDSPTCNLCNCHEQTIIHLFSTCSKTHFFWKEVLSWLKIKGVLCFEPCFSDILLSIFRHNKNNILLNTIFLLGKYYFFSCMYQIKCPQLQVFICKLHNLYELECQISLLKSKADVNSMKWNFLFVI